MPDWLDTSTNRGGGGTRYELQGARQSGWVVGVTRSLDLVRGSKHECGTFRSQGPSYSAGSGESRDFRDFELHLAQPTSCFLLDLPWLQRLSRKAFHTERLLVLASTQYDCVCHSKLSDQRIARNWPQCRDRQYPEVSLELFRELGGRTVYDADMSSPEVSCR